MSKLEELIGLILERDWQMHEASEDAVRAGDDLVALAREVAAEAGIYTPPDALAYGPPPVFLDSRGFGGECSREGSDEKVQAALARIRARATMDPCDPDTP